MSRRRAGPYGSMTFTMAAGYPSDREVRTYEADGFQAIVEARASPALALDRLRGAVSAGCCFEAREHANAAWRLSLLVRFYATLSRKIQHRSCRSAGLIAALEGFRRVASDWTRDLRGRPIPRKRCFGPAGPTRWLQVYSRLVIDPAIS